jgi:hypothetical protein
MFMIMKNIYANNHCMWRSVLLLICIQIGLAEIHAQVPVEMTSGITSECTGQVSVEVNGNWLNQGNLIPGSSSVLLSGAYAQMLRQDGGSFYNLTINKNGNEVTLSGNINVAGGIMSVLQNDVQLNGHLITLNPSALLNETPGNTVKGSTGYTTTTRIMTSPTEYNVGGMGLKVSNTGDFGLTEIRRGHAAQSANMVQGIQRYFDFIPSQPLATESTVTFFYDDSELNGNTEADLQLYASPDFGVNWKKIGGILDTANNSVTVSGITMYSRFTLSSHCLETCIATQALTHSATLYLNAFGIAYLPVEMINNGSTGACGIDSMNVAPNVFDCDDIGLQQVVLTVTDHHGCSKSATATVEVIDTVMPVVLCKNISVEMNGCSVTIQPADIDDGSWDACSLALSLDVSTFDCSDIGVNTVHLIATDASANTSICSATVTITQPVEVICENTMVNMSSNTVLVLNPFDFVEGNQGNYPGYTFVLNPSVITCDDLGEKLITLTATAPNGMVTICQSTLLVNGPDAIVMEYQMHVIFAWVGMISRIRMVMVSRIAQIGTDGKIFPRIGNAQQTKCLFVIVGTSFASIKTR